MNRREFLSILSFYSETEELLKRRKSTETLDFQILMIRSLHELCLKCNYSMFVVFPYSRYDKRYDDWYTTTQLQVLGMSKEGVLLQITEDLEDIQNMFEFVKGNWINFKDLPEVINFNGIVYPIFEIFRLELPKLKY